MTYINQTIQATPAWRLDADISRGPHGNLLRFVSLVPHAIHPEERLQFQALLSDAELQTLQKVLSAAVASATL
jgi:hypothetical protein